MATIRDKIQVSKTYEVDRDLHAGLLVHMVEDSHVEAQGLLEERLDAVVDEIRADGAASLQGCKEIELAGLIADLKEQTGEAEEELAELRGKITDPDVEG